MSPLEFPHLLGVFSHSFWKKNIYASAIKTKKLKGTQEAEVGRPYEPKSSIQGQPVRACFQQRREKETLANNTSTSYQNSEKTKQNKTKTKPVRLNKEQTY